MVNNRRFSPTVFLIALLLAFCLSSLGSRAETAEQPPQFGGDPHLGYGFNVASWDVSLIQSVGFDWMKVFDTPSSRLPVNILLRVNGNAQNLGDLNGYGQQIHQLAQNSGANIEAYEIGNEPNLDANYGWNAAPIAADYAALLCVAYENIKEADPTAIVVSAGLAPTGRVQGNWNGHAGHNGFYQDERQFLLEFLAAGGGDCVDAIGYHPYGFSADYNAVPDVPSGDPTQNCTNGFCFRGVEKIYELMQANGYGDKSVWATEFGWIVAPPDECLDDPGWQGRAWQIVSLQQQAINLVGAFNYAEAHWPWMGGMFIFNLNFNKSGLYDLCEQMRYYAVEDRPAEPALGNMAKNPVPTNPVLGYAPPAINWLVDVDDLPLSTSYPIKLENGGWQPMDYTLSVTAENGVTVSIPQPSGQVGRLEPVTAQVNLQINQPLGAYTATLHIEASPDTTNAPADIPIEVHVVPEVYRAMMAVVVGGG
ncbi:MAG: hypothetical protein WAM60_20950 [Candidatus Promineifilaceae bacterium]